MHTATPTLQDLIKSAQAGALDALGKQAPVPTKTASARTANDDLEYSQKLAATSLAVAGALRKQAAEGGESPGVSTAISPPGLPAQFAHSSAKPGTSHSSTTAKPEPGAAPASLETSHAKSASEGGGAIPESNASQPDGQPAGGKPKGPLHLLASNEAARSITPKDTYAPREQEMAGLLSQGMNDNDNALQLAFKHHEGAKTAAVPDGAQARAFGGKVRELGEKAKDFLKEQAGKVVPSKHNIEEHRRAALGYAAAGNEMRRDIHAARASRLDLQRKGVQAAGVATAGLGAAGAAKHMYDKSKQQGEPEKTAGFKDLGDKVKAVIDKHLPSKDSINQAWRTAQTRSAVGDGWGAIGQAAQADKLNATRHATLDKLKAGGVAVAGLGAAGAAKHMHDKGKEAPKEEAKTAQDLSIKTASAEELIRQLAEQVNGSK